MEEFGKKLREETSEDLAHMIFSTEMIKEYPSLE